MSNMSYCRFRNTLEDLQDCADGLSECSFDLSELGPEEQRAAKKLIELCREIASDADHYQDEEV